MSIDVPLAVRRAAAALLVVLVVPVLVTLGTFTDEAPLVVDEESPRTVVADRPVQVEDRAATEDARAQARLDVVPQTTIDLDAERDVLNGVRTPCTEIRLARTPVDETTEGVGGQPTVSTRVPTEAEQFEAVRDQVTTLDDEALRLLVSLTDEQLDQVRDNTVDVVQELLGDGITEEELEDVLDVELTRQLNRRSWPEGVAQQVVAPLVRAEFQPTVEVDAAETQRLQDEAEAAVEPVVERWDEGDIVVEAGETVSEVQLQALEQLGEAGSEPGIAFVRALVAMVLVVSVFGLYLLRSQPQVWDDPGRLFVLSGTTIVAALLLYVAKVLVGAFGIAWWFVFPIGGIVLLIAVLTSPQVGMASVLPLATLALLFAPSVPALTILVTAVVVVAAPMVARISTRVGLRRASVRVALAAPVMAVVVAVVFGPRDQATIPTVAVAAAIGGIANVGLLQGLLPAFENVFRLATVTALLDLADRNHPLLRELEQKAMGSYNHSVMVASLAERCCREIGANHLLGQVAGLYHDIGKVRQPVFFIENQRGIANPHDQLTPRMSAVIIQNHVVDGVEMAIEHRLPPDVVDCIASHHGTMRVGYFYKLALDAVGGDESRVDEAHFRYKGHKPRSKEAGVLLLADCTEAATRAMAMDRGTLPTDVISSTVDKLVRDRLDDGQFEDCELTFVEFQQVRDTLVEALTGIYHPRIGYPAGTSTPAAVG